MFCLHTINNLDIQRSKYETGNEDVEKLTLNKEFESVFRDELPPGLPPKRDVNHEIELDEGTKPPHKDFFHFSPAEIIATEKYVIDLLKKK